MLAAVGHRRWLAWFAALALLSLAPRILRSAAHDHGLAKATGESCAACLVAHTPAAPDDAPAVLPPPIARSTMPVAPSLVVAPGGFSFAVPLACGPPA